MQLDFTLLVDTRCETGESPVWDERRDRLFFVDIGAPALHAVALDGSDLRSWPMPKPIGSIGLAESGRIVAGLGRGIALFDPEAGSLTPFLELPDEPEANRLNDGKVGPDGAFWVGSMNQSPVRQPIASLYRVTPEGVAERKIGDLATSNGLAFSPDGRTMFHSDSRGEWIDRHDFDPATGAISNRRRIATPDEATGRPDGAACDAEGVYWSAGVSAGRLNRFSPEGELLGSHPVPVPSPTMPCFCGPDLRTLVITSLRPGGGAAQNPHSGSVFIARSPVAGAPVARWRDM